MESQNGHLALSSKVHTAGCERVFSAQNLSLTPLRNRLTGETQDILLRIKLHFNKIDLLKAYEQWAGGKKREIKSKALRSMSWFWEENPLSHPVTYELQKRETFLIFMCHF